CVMVVVPALAEDKQRDDPVVPRLVTGAIVLASEHVADRVHAERRMLIGGDADQPAPDEPFDAGSPRSTDPVPDRKRDPEREHDPKQVQTIDRAYETILVQIAPVLPALLHPEVAEHPADVR